MRKPDDLVARLRLTPDEATRHEAADEIGRLRRDLRTAQKAIERYRGRMRAIRQWAKE
jgi:hypothetical protein